MTEYKYYFGTYNKEITLTNSHKDNNGEVIPAGKITLGEWELKHVTSVTEREESSCSTVGIPNKPSECTYIFDSGGPVRTFTISGKRYDSEEEVSNLDFIHTQFNLRQISDTCDAHSSEGRDKYNVYMVGIEWLTSTLQSTLQGYQLRRVASNLDTSERVPIGDMNNLIYGEVYNVGLTSFSYTLDTETPGLMEYSLTLTERMSYAQGPVYREYTPVIQYESGSSISE